MQIAKHIFRPYRFLKPVRSFCFIIILLLVTAGGAQNTISKTIEANTINQIVVDGNQIFKISIATSDTEVIQFTSTLDGEYQNEYQVIDEVKDDVLSLQLIHQSFSDIVDDKRNAHKVIAATLQLEIPEDLSLRIKSDVGSVDAIGNFKNVLIELQQGFCNVKGSVETAIINTFDGNISVYTLNAKIEAVSNKGSVVITDFGNHNSYWQLKTINGDITVAKQE